MTKPMTGALLRTAFISFLARPSSKREESVFFLHRFAIFYVISNITVDRKVQLEYKTN